MNRKRDVYCEIAARKRVCLASDEVVFASQLLHQQHCQQSLLESVYNLKLSSTCCLAVIVEVNVPPYPVLMRCVRLVARRVIRWFIARYL